MLREMALVIPLLLALGLGSGTSVNAESSFERLARKLEQQLNLQREHIPAKWLVNSVLFVSRPAGVKNLDIATFENFNGDDERAAGAFFEIVKENVGDGWKPWMRSSSKRDGERLTIYARPADKDWEMLVATVEPGEASLIRMKIDSKRMAEYIRDHKSYGEAGREGR